MTPALDAQLVSNRLNSDHRYKLENTNEICSLLNLSAFLVAKKLV
jgi:hypothetical protein